MDTKKDINAIEKASSELFTFFGSLFKCLNPAEVKACNFIKKETLAQAFSWELCEIPKNNFFTVELWTTAAVRPWKFCNYSNISKS